MFKVNQKLPMRYFQLLYFLNFVYLKEIKEEINLVEDKAELDKELPNLCPL